MRQASLPVIVRQRLLQCKLSRSFSLSSSVLEGSTPGAPASQNADASKVAAESPLDQPNEPATPKRKAPVASSLGNIIIPAFNKIIPDAPPSKRVRPDLTWIANDGTGAGSKFTFTQRMASKRLRDLNDAEGTVSPSWRHPLPPVFEHHNSQPSAGSTRMDIPSGKRGQGIQDANPETRRAAEERRKIRQERRALEQRKAADQTKRTREESQIRRRREESEKRKAVEKEVKQAERDVPRAKQESEPTVYADMPRTDFEAIKAFANIPSTAEALKSRMKLITAVNGGASEEKDVESLTVARIQRMRERAGDYSRYLRPDLVSMSETEALGPLAYAELALARRRGAGLVKRHEALKIVHRFTKMTESRVET